MSEKKAALSPAATHSNSIESIVKKTISGKQEIINAVQQLSEEDPAHKQGQNQWLFDALQQQVKSVEKQSGRKFDISQGSPLVWKHKKESMDFPVPLPSSKDNDAILLFTEGPEHETFMYSMALLVIDLAAAAVREIK